METHPSYAGTLTHYLSAGAIVGMIIGLLWVIYVAVVWNKKGNRFMETISRFVLPLGFLGSFVGMSLSLFYSEVLHFVPCELCWFQRIFLYPLVFIFGLAWYRKERNVFPYALLLAGIGGIIALYHHMLQIGFDLMKPCSDAPFAVDCAKPEFIEFGFVTFPLMSAVLFGFLSVFIIVALKIKSK